jgi:diaminopimelate epimerase
VLDDAPALRSHPDLGPGGANVDFFAARGRGRVDARYYERGIEGETLSSGSGTIAVALAAVHLGLATSPVTCTNRLGLQSTVTLVDSPKGLEATLAGDARIVFSGRLRRDTLAGIERAG